MATQIEWAGAVTLDECVVNLSKRLATEQETQEAAKELDLLRRFFGKRKIAEIIQKHQQENQSVEQ